MTVNSYRGLVHGDIIVHGCNNIFLDYDYSDKLVYKACTETSINELMIIY